MRHRLKGRKLGKTTAHRAALVRSMVTSLFLYGRIMTTYPKAMEMRAPAEKLITLGKRVLEIGSATPEAKRLALAPFRAILDVVRDPKVAKKISGDVAKRFVTRPGGYTRVVKLGGCRWDGEGHGLYAWNRLGDNGARAILELIDRREPDEELRLAGRGKLAVPKSKEKAAGAKEAKAKPASK